MVVHEWIKENDACVINMIMIRKEANQKTNGIGLIRPNLAYFGNIFAICLETCACTFGFSKAFLQATYEVNLRVI
jgi:hypothetical protein